MRGSRDLQEGAPRRTGLAVTWYVLTAQNLPAWLVAFAAVHCNVKPGIAQGTMHDNKSNAEQGSVSAPAHPARVTFLNAGNVIVAVSEEKRPNGAGFCGSEGTQTITLTCKRG